MIITESRLGLGQDMLQNKDYCLHDKYTFLLNTIAEFNFLKDGLKDSRG